MVGATNDVAQAPAVIRVGDLRRGAHGRGLSRTRRIGSREGSRCGSWHGRFGGRFVREKGRPGFSAY